MIIGMHCTASRLCTTIYVTRFEKTQLPHTQDQTYQNWIAGSIHYHITLSALIRNQESNFVAAYP